jgi:hypothetical protein
MRPFPKAEAPRESRMQKISVGAVLTDTAVKIALEAEVEALAKPVKCNRLLSDSQEKSYKLKQLKMNVQIVELSEEEDESFCIECV